MATGTFMTEDILFMKREEVSNGYLMAGITLIKIAESFE